MDIKKMRQEYSNEALDIEALATCPFEQFESWLSTAVAENITEPNAMVLATVDQQHRPTSRTVLLKYYDSRGFVFFTNLRSRKATQIATNAAVSVLFPWLQVHRQLEINARAEKLSVVEAMRYFALRPRGSQLGAWASEQSQVISSRGLLKQKFEEVKKKFAAGKLPMPPAWGGYRLVPNRFEFWQGGLNRLHDRIVYLPTDQADTWLRQRLAP